MWVDVKKKKRKSTKIWKDCWNSDIRNEKLSTIANRSLWQLCHHPVPLQAWQDSAKAQNSRATDYYTAPSLASCCHLMGSWKVKMKSSSLSTPFRSPISSLRQSAVSDRCHRICLPVCRLPSSPLMASQVRPEGRKQRSQDEKWQSHG